MIEGLGASGSTPLHRLPAGAKFAGLAVIATALFFIGSVPVLLAALVVALVVALSTGRGPARLVRDLAMPGVVIAAIGGVHLVAGDPQAAAEVVPRLLALALLAHAVVLTTTTAAAVEAFEAGLMPFERIGLIDAARTALTLTLALRFVPLIVEEAAAIREAQAARGLGSHPIAVVVPLVVRTLVRAGEVADAIDARGFPPRAVSRKSS